MRAVPRHPVPQALLLRLGGSSLSPRPPRLPVMLAARRGRVPIVAGAQRVVQRVVVGHHVRPPVLLEKLQGGRARLRPGQLQPLQQLPVVGRLEVEHLPPAKGIRRRANSLWRRAIKK
eukprot:791043-Prorocentrum_minimum.AAC.1